MSVYDCPVKGTAEVRDVWNEPLQQYVPEWTRADEEIHIDGGFVDHPIPRALIEKLYVIGEQCLYHLPRRVYHARLREGAKGEV